MQIGPASWLGLMPNQLCSLTAGPTARVDRPSPLGLGVNYGTKLASILSGEGRWYECLPDTRVCVAGGVCYPLSSSRRPSTSGGAPISKT